MSRPVVRRIMLAGAVVLALLLIAAVHSAVAGPPDPGAVGVVPDAVAGTQAAAATLWSSGWVAIPPNTPHVFFHNLGRAPEEYGVDVLFRDLEGGLGIHRRFYGGTTQGSLELGAHWPRLNATSLMVSRWKDDTVVDQVLVRVWVPPSPPDYDSGWTAIAPGAMYTFTHGLAATPTDLTVGLVFSNTTGGIHQFAYGGLVSDGPVLRGAYWHNLSENTVRVTRLANDSTANLVRVTVPRSTPPAYDSLLDRGGWVSVAPGASVTFAHNLGVGPEALVVRGECFSPDPALGIHQAFAGGEYDERIAGWIGSNLQNMTENAVTVYRQAQDTLCPQVRVVVYDPTATRNRLSLPLIQKNRAAP